MVGEPVLGDMVGTEDVGPLVGEYWAFGGEVAYGAQLGGKDIVSEAMIPILRPIGAHRWRTQPQRRPGGDEDVNGS